MVGTTICFMPVWSWNEINECRIEGEENEETPYIKKFILFASERVAEKVIDKLERNYNQQLRNFVIASSSENEYSMLRGVIFEQIAHRILQKGGSFCTRSLESDFTSTIEILEQIKLLFNDINKIKEGKYCQPIQKNFSSIDAIVAPHTLFQMTVSRNHPINVNGMKKLVEKLGGKSGTNHIYFYFVLPKDLYDNYQAQPFYTNGQTVAKRIPYWITNRVKQYALNRLEFLMISLLYGINYDILSFYHVLQTSVYALKIDLSSW
ncbi:putative crinkler family protein [Gigaspora margarita]|uniref:Putative crinkler family protein n=1 Tax=Gigaspora margarita TaxID=4874 RepID=A0A8H4ENK5_GIGMA|nr:putative crinkler family protein [Gigaspora margarita]